MNHEITRDEEKSAQPFSSSVLVSQRVAIVSGIKQVGRRVAGDDGRGARGAEHGSANRSSEGFEETMMGVAWEAPGML